MIDGKVFIGRDNITTIRLEYNGEPIDFAATTRIVLEIVDFGIEVDSDLPEHSGMIDWSLGDGMLAVRLGMLPGIEPGYSAARVVSFDSTHPNGQVLLHDRLGMHLELDFVDG